MKVGVKVDSVL